MINASLKQLFILMPALLLGLACAGLGTGNKTPAEKFEPLVFKNAQGEQLRYRFLKPLNYDPQKAYPLIFFMHGAGERGSDNTITLKHFLPQICSAKLMRKYPCFVIAPQVPENGRWSDVRNWQEGVSVASPEPAPALRLALELIARTRKEYSIDAKRIYVTGISMGGYGTWDVLWRRPDMFAAAVPICGGGIPSKAPIFAHTPIWAFHGGADPTVPVQKSREMIVALKKAGAHPRYTEFRGVGHDSWTRAYKTQELYRWLFAQHLP